jgi:hypothetical protein
VDGNIRTTIASIKQCAVNFAVGDGYSPFVRYLDSLIPDFGIPNLEQAAGRKHGEFRKLQHRAFDPPISLIVESLMVRSALSQA